MRGRTEGSDWPTSVTERCKAYLVRPEAAQVAEAAATARKGKRKMVTTMKMLLKDENTKKGKIKCRRRG